MRNHDSIDIALPWSAGIKVRRHQQTLGISITEFAIARTIRLLACASQGMVGSANPTTCSKRVLEKEICTTLC